LLAGHGAGEAAANVIALGEWGKGLRRSGIAVVHKATHNAMLGKRAKSMMHWVGRNVLNRRDEQFRQIQQDQ
jgi:hypothetical protein